MTNGNDTAFPTDVWCESRNGGFYQEGTDPGLTKREYFAALAMQGMMANATHLQEVEPEEWLDNAVSIANALIEALNREAKQ